MGRTAFALELERSPQTASSFAIRVSPRGRSGVAARTRTKIPTSERRDWASAVERSYDLEADDPAWLAGIVAQVAPLLDGVDTAAWSFRCAPTTLELEGPAESGPVVFTWLARAFHEWTEGSWLDLLYRGGRVVDRTSRVHFLVEPDVRPALDALFGPDARDVLLVGAHSGTGRGVVIVTLLETAAAPTPAQRRRWPQIASHIGAGLRLRAATGALARDSAGTPRARLREAVRRTGSDADAVGGGEGARNVWERLIDGRWSLVDRFDADGRRFVVALEMEPAHADPRALTPREHEVGELMGRGQSSKEIAYSLGLSLSAVTNAVASAMTKLALTSRAGLAEIFSSAAPRPSLAELTMGGERLHVITSPLFDVRGLAELTDAERDVVTHLIAGATTADIARQRGSSLNTVSTQVQSLYRKLGVHSRNELAALLRARPRASVPV